MTAPTATLLISCPDQQGLVAKIANFIYANGGNVVHADQHRDEPSELFLSRIEWQLEGFNLKRELIGPAFDSIAKPLGATWQLHCSDVVSRMAIWVSKQNHCLLDLLWRHQAGELAAEIPLIMSNHETLRPIAEQFNIAFHHIPMTKATKPEQEAKQLALLKEHTIDVVVLAKYMQILSPDFLSQFPQIINIHHSFLPAFVGANPYHRAYERGVKLIGATAHFVTPDLDEGPIIEQQIAKVDHTMTPNALVEAGRDVERQTLARAVQYYVERRILLNGMKTVVFQ